MSRDPVADRIATLLRERGISNSELAARIGAPPATVQKWVRQGAAPGAGFLAKIPGALGINGHWLLTGQGQIEPPGEQPDLEELRRVVAAETIELVGRALMEARDQTEAMAAEYAKRGMAPDGSPLATSPGEAVRAVAAAVDPVVQAHQRKAGQASPKRKRPA